MTTTAQKLVELRRILKLHANWILYATLGESALSASELTELHVYGKLPMDGSLDLVEKSYLLGRLRAVTNLSEYRNVSEVSMDGTVLTPPEAAALEAARSKSIVRIKRHADDLAATFITDATLVGAKRATAVKKRFWDATMRSEFQTAKIQGIAHTIANKSDIYLNSDGADSDVSIIPAKACCQDCREHYVDASGNPKIFKLSDLMGSGSNADVGTIHTRADGKHAHWKTTLPPLHPSCGCNLVYVPPGHGWTDGHLSLINKSLFMEHLAKATAGVRGPGGSPTVAPTGAPSQAKEPGAPSVPGAAAPGNVAGPGRPPGGIPKPGSGSGGAGGGPQFQPCPFGGGAGCQDNGGNGAAMHKRDGDIMKKHQAAIAGGAQPTTPEAKEAQRKQMDSDAKQFNAREPHQEVVHDHLSEGEIGSVTKLGDEGGVNASYKITIKGNGSGLMKPHISLDAYLPDVYGAKKLAGKSPQELEKMADGLAAPGAGTMPTGMNPKAEAGMSGLANGLGLGNLFPVTTVRTHDGSQEGPKGVTSVQHWRDNAVSLDKYAGTDSGYKELMKTVPAEHKEKVHEQLSTIAVMDVVSNNGDRHLGNVMMDKESHDAIPIDHGTAFGNGMYGSRNDIAQEMHGAGKPLVIPPQLHEKLKNQSLDATFRSLDESGLPDWAKAQTVLRQKYVLHMQDKFDHIPFDRIRPTVTSRSGSTAPYWNAGSNQCMGWMDKGGIQGYFDAESAGELPQDQFNGFAKAWMEERVNDPSHPEHQDAKRLYTMQPIRTSGHVTGKEEATAESLSKHYASIPSYDLSEPNAGKYKSAMPGKAKENVGELRTAPQMPEKKTAPAKARSGEEKKTVPRGKKASTVELQDSDLEEVDSSKNHSKDAYAQTGVQLDLSEFDDDSDIDQAFDKIRAKTVAKSLYLANPQAIFRVDDDSKR